MILPHAQRQLIALLILGSGLSHAQSEKNPIPMEKLAGEGVWIAPAKSSPVPILRARQGRQNKEIRVSVWFDQQLLGASDSYRRRAEEFSTIGRREMRSRVVASLKAQNERSLEAARAKLDALVSEETIGNLRPHWIVNGFSCTTTEEGLQEIAKVPGVRKIFRAEFRNRREQTVKSNQALPELPAPAKPRFDQLPWYVPALKADQTWKDFEVAGSGTLNVIHDRNFVPSDYLSRSAYRNPDEIADNGKDDDGNGLIDDVHGFNFDTMSNLIYTRKLSGDSTDRRNLHGTSCANIICGPGDDTRARQFGVAPLARWAGVINSSGIEQSVEWAIEQGADTYSMSFSIPHLGDYRSHWRKVMEHGSFCGVFFVSGAGNYAQKDEVPVQMRVPEGIPEAVFAAAGVKRDLSRTPFSSQGPVLWKTEHYQDGFIPKPEVCAFNFGVPLQMPDGSVIENLLGGNSYAGPMFAGSISLMLSADPDLLPWDLKEIIMKNATDVGPAGFDFQTGHGLINCHASVKEVLARKKAREE